jgi:TPR repeat protein/serine/threonine protein kinase
MKTCPHCTSGYHDSLTSCPTHGGLLNEIRDLKPGLEIRATYKIVRKLGQGGMGAVYLAEHMLMGEQRALKFLNQDLASDAAFTSRFLREVKTLRRLRHPNVVDCGDLERAEDDSLFFAMEFVDGPDLRNLMVMARGPMPVPMALEIVRGIAEGLGAAHRLGLVHRDIKPENILMAREGERWLPKIADFGIVATKESSTQHTRTGASLLTMTYAAPEQWRGMKSNELDGRTDLYALGGMMYEILTGRTAFDAENYEGWSAQHLTLQPTPPSELNPELKMYPGVDDLVLKLLAKDRDQRPDNVAQAIQMIGLAEGSAGVLQRETEVVPEQPAEVPVPGVPLARPRFRRLLLWVALPVLLLAVVATVVLSVKFAPKMRFNRASDLLQQQRFVEALPLLESSCDGGEIKACYELGNLYEYGNGVTQDLGKARLLYQKICDGGDVSACINVAQFYEDGEGVTQDYGQAMKLFLKACEGGKMAACSKLGFRYEHGQGITQDYGQARTLYQKACDGGDMSGCNRLGQLYGEGKGVAQDYGQAEKIFMKACDSGDVYFCSKLAVRYQDGTGVAQDYGKARQLYQKLCDGGTRSGCNELGNIYAKGQGVAQDYGQARQFYQKACDGDEVSACNSMGEFYEKGQGVTQDYGQARQLYQKACDGQLVYGCINIGGLYEKGHGVAKDLGQARQIYQKACDDNYPIGCESLKRLP